MIQKLSTQNEKYFDSIETDVRHCLYDQSHTMNMYDTYGHINKQLNLSRGN